MIGFSEIPNFSGSTAGARFCGAVTNALGGSATIRPTLEAATATTGHSVSEAVAAATITGAAVRTLTAWKTDRINFADYAGADPTGTTDRYKAGEQGSVPHSVSGAGAVREYDPLLTGNYFAGAPAAPGIVIIFW